MIKLFAEIQAKIWWRSLKKIELAGLIFYTFFILILLVQVWGVIYVLLFIEDSQLAIEIYSWLTPDVQKLLHLLTLNSIWFLQLFITKTSRLQIAETRKLLALGFPLKKLSLFVSLAALFHPVHLIFHLLWIFYLGLLGGGGGYYLLGAFVALINFCAISIFKWNFKLASAKWLKWINRILMGVIAVIITTPYFITIKMKPLRSDQFVAWLTDWLVYSPGGLLYEWFSGQFAAISFSLSFFAALLLITYLSKMFLKHTKLALLTPLSSDFESESSHLGTYFIEWFGPEGGKYLFTIWSHPYSRMQLLLITVVVIGYSFMMMDGTKMGNYMIGVFMTFLPITFLTVTLSNAFGFENRELLLSLQLPVRDEEIFVSRFKAALITLCGVALLILILIPFLIESPLTMLQFYLGILLINILFLHYLLTGCITNYKKVEKVGLMSVSNPVIPMSVSMFTGFLIFILGGAVFYVFDNYQLIHTLILVAGTLALIQLLLKRFRNISAILKKQLIPKLWNEL